MSELHISYGKKSNKIYIGTATFKEERNDNFDTHLWGPDKQDVTLAACDAVADFITAYGGSVVFYDQNGKPTHTLTIEEL